MSGYGGMGGYGGYGSYLPWGGQFQNTPWGSAGQSPNSPRSPWGCMNPNDPNCTGQHSPSPGSGPIWGGPNSGGTQPLGQTPYQGGLSQSRSFGGYSLAPSWNVGPGGWNSFKVPTTGLQPLQVQR